MKDSTLYHSKTFEKREKKVNLVTTKTLHFNFFDDEHCVKKSIPSIFYFSKIPRYIITLHEILAHTPHEHVERRSLENARVQLEHLSRQMHDEVRILHTPN